MSLARNLGFQFLGLKVYATSPVIACLFMLLFHEIVNVYMQRSGFKHLLLFLDIAQKGFSFLCMKFLGGRGHKCAWVHEEPLRECQKEAVWDPGWVPVNQDIYLETTLQFGNGSGRRGGKGWGSLGLSVSLTTWTPFPPASAWQGQQWSRHPTHLLCPISSISKKHKQNGRKENTQWAKC